MNKELEKTRNYAANLKIYECSAPEDTTFKSVEKTLNELKETKLIRIKDENSKHIY